jgi:hypothetical protein
MKRIAAIATFNGRQEYLKKAVASLAHQVDEIRIYDNEVRPIDLTDNGKFFFLQEYKEPVYYFTCDDDLLYPPTYIQDMVNAIERTGGIVTHHGRILRGQGLRYYSGHKAYHCLKENRFEARIHVAGTGVTGFRTDYFNPVDIWQSEDKCMSDLVFSVEAARQRKKITVLKHEHGYIKYLDVPLSQTIFGTHRNKDTRQSELADLILTLSA